LVIASLNASRSVIPRSSGTAISLSRTMGGSLASMSDRNGSRKSNLLRVVTIFGVFALEELAKND
jgi:hypothetical protein